MKRLIFLGAGMFAIGCDNYVIAGLLPGIGATLNASEATVGQGVTAFDLTYLVSAPAFAVLLAGRSVRTVLLAALTLFTFGNLLTLLSTNVAMYLISRGIAGVGAGLYIPVAVAAATAAADSDATGRGRALSLIWGANSAGAVAGVPVGLWLASLRGWQWAIGLILALSAVSLAGVARGATRHSDVRDVRAEAPPSLAERTRVLADRRVLAIVGVTLVTATGSLGLYTYTAPLIQRAGAAHSVATALWAWSIGGLIGSTAIGYLADRTERPQLLMASVLMLLTIAVLILPTLQSVPVLGLVPYVLWGAAGWATVTPQQCALIEIQPTQATTALALNGSAIGLGSGLGSALGGLAIAGGLGAPHLPYAAAALLLAALLWQWTLLDRTAPREAV
jgi:predicted MFS family arabinose efflux permease